MTELRLRGGTVVLLGALLASCGREKGQEADAQHRVAETARLQREEPLVSQGILDATGRFEDEAIGFSMQVPAHLAQTSPSAGATVAFQGEWEGRPESLNLVVTPRRQMDAERLLEGRITELRQHCPAWRLRGLQPYFTSFGDRGKILDFEWIAAGRPIRQRQLLLAGQDQVFTLTATWPATDSTTEDEPSKAALAVLTFELLPTAR